jgi:hypothetical protein
MEAETILAWDKKASTSFAFGHLYDPVGGMLDREDWIMAFSEIAYETDEETLPKDALAPAHLLRYFKISSLEERVIFWSDCIEEKRNRVKTFLDLVPSANIQGGTSTKKFQEGFYIETKDLVQELERCLHNNHPISAELKRRSTIKAIATIACGKSWQATDQDIKDFCCDILMKLKKRDSSTIEFFDMLTFQSRRLLYETTERLEISYLRATEVEQAIFEATHSMCLTNGGYDLSLNVYFAGCDDAVYYFEKDNRQTDRVMHEIRTLYINNWRTIQSSIEARMEAPDYQNLQNWIKTCRHLIEQTFSSRNRSYAVPFRLFNKEYLFSTSTNVNYQHALIALFYDIVLYPLELSSPIESKPQSSTITEQKEKSLYFSATQSSQQNKVIISPGAIRALKVLKMHPNGLTVKELLPLTKQDALSEETPRGSMDAWVLELKKGGHAIHEQKSKNKKWFFVKDYES